MALRVRALTDEEQQIIERLAHSRTAAARTVERARLIWHATQGARVPTIAKHLHLHEQTVRLWLKRFNTAGLPALHDAPRSGRPATYTPDEVSTVIATALTKPDTLGLPFGMWTLDRLEAYLNEHCQIRIKRSRIDEILLAEGLRWRQDETWFSERVDPDFAAKRGRLNGSILNRQSGVS
jgi:transposase